MLQGYWAVVLQVLWPLRITTPLLFFCNGISVYKGMMSKKRNKKLEVLGMQVILKQKDEKLEQEKDLLMERMQRRMGMG